MQGRFPRLCQPAPHGWTATRRASAMGVGARPILISRGHEYGALVGSLAEETRTELVAGGRSRLAAASLSGGLVIGIVFGFMNFAPLDDALAAPPNLFAANIVAGLCIASCLLMYGITRSPLETPQVMRIALVYEVVGALGIALAEALATQHAGGTVRGVSWVCLWIALFPIVVPSSPGRTLAAAMASATMGLIAIYIAAFLGVERPSFPVTLYLVTPNFGAAGLAVLFSRLIHQLGTDAKRAREMGSYRLEELLGRGGMGEVWRARHRMLARPAAIKLVTLEALGAKGADPTRVLKRFEREARATSMLSSQNTIHIYDFGRTADGTLYYVMELLDGVDLETLVEETGPLPPERAIAVLRQVCTSLAEAHSSGLVHRDIKPANIYLCRLGQEHDRVKVLDFGIVAIRDDPDDRKPRVSTQLTGDNAIAGTPAYMAPETVTKSHPIDHRVDIYALGCVAYWLVAGELVFDGETAVKIIFGHMEEAPIAPSERVGTSLPHGLEALILRCLEKNPADRPKNAMEVRAALDDIVADRWTEERAAAWWKHHPIDVRDKPKSSRLARDTIMKA